MRQTKQKKLILDIINHSCTHPTANEIYLKCVKEMPNISLGTVYRNLNVLVQAKQIKKITMDGYDRYDNLIKPHHHFICLDCGEIIDVNYDLDTYLDGNKIVDYEFKGICHKCLGKEDVNGIKRNKN